MNEELIEKMIFLLTEIKESLNELNNKVSSTYDLSDVCSKLDYLDSKLRQIENNTSN